MLLKTRESEARSRNIPRMFLSIDAASGSSLECNRVLRAWARCGILHGRNSLNQHVLCKYFRDVSTPRPSVTSCSLFPGAPLNMTEETISNAPDKFSAVAVLPQSRLNWRPMRDSPSAGASGFLRDGGFRFLRRCVLHDEHERSRSVIGHHAHHIQLCAWGRW